MTYLIMHLSDIHIQNEQDRILSRADDIAKTTYNYLADVERIFIIVTGDIAYSGKQQQYTIAKLFFEKISAKILSERDLELDFIFCPGNHDCDFDSPQQKIRNTIIESISDVDEVEEEEIDLCTQVQSNYFTFRDELEQPSKSNDPLWKTHTFKSKNKTIQINSLNVAWLSRLNEQQGQLTFPTVRYEHQDKIGIDLVITIMHHPFNWFSSNTYRRFRSLIRKNSDLIITGHEHSSNVGLINESESDLSTFIEGTALQESNSDNSGFNLIKLNIDSEQFCCSGYVWDGRSYIHNDVGNWSDWRPLVISNNNPYSLQPNFQSYLDEPGVFIKHPFSTSVTLSDIYTSPDLKNINDSKASNHQIINSDKITETLSDTQNLIIAGEEKSGRSSLLRHIYLTCHEKNLVPLYLEGKDIKKASSNDLEKIIQKATQSQYLNVDNVTQSPKSSKILLIDDFDDTPLKGKKSILKLMAYLDEKFHKIIICVGDMFEIRSFLDGASITSLGDIIHYQIQPFGYQRRAALIKKWFLLGQSNQLSETELLNQCDKAERLIDTVMSKMIIPASPIYLITLLQSVNSEIHSDFQNSSLAEYYRFLLTSAFQQIGVNKDKLSASINYAAHLAWEYHLNSSTQLSKLDLLRFNKLFSEQWYTVDFEKKLEELLKSRVLIKCGDDYAFHYPYIYYYLKGLYISQNLTDESIREYIRHCCHHLYVREHANTILFLAHHSNESFIIDSIVASYQKLFSSSTPVHFNSDTDRVNQIIIDAPELPFFEKSPEEHRERKNKLRDEMKHDSDGLLDNEEESNELSMVAQLTMLQKSSEILGQVLKNQYSAIKRHQKQVYIRELFNGHLRALSSFYDFVSHSPEHLIQEIEKVLQKHNKTLDGASLKKFARKVTTEIIQFLSVNFIVRASESAASENLLENINEAVEENGTVAFKLIELAVILDSPKHIPRKQLSLLLKEIGDDLITNRIIKILVMNRLYMFKTTEVDMQWLRDSDLNLSLPSQHAITYAKHKERVMK